MAPPRDSNPVSHIQNLRRQAHLVRDAAEHLRNGGLVVFPTETVYGLGARADDEEAIRRLYEVKRRPSSRPLTLHLPDTRSIDRYVQEIPAAAQQLIELYLPGPLMLLMHKSEAVPDYVTSGLLKVGIRVPNHPLAAEFLKSCDVPVAATSANISGRLSATSVTHVLDDLGDTVDAILEWRDPPLGLESTVVDATTDPVRVLRLGFVTTEELEMALGTRPLLSGDRPAPARFTRFSPEARLIVVEGEPERVARRLKLLSESHLATDRVCVLLTQEATGHSFPPGVAVRVMGSRDDHEAIASVLFELLRDLEREGTGVVLVEGIERSGLGNTIMERLCQAASQVVNTANPGYSGQAGAQEVL